MVCPDMVYIPSKRQGILGVAYFRPLTQYMSQQPPIEQRAALLCLDGDLAGGWRGMTRSITEQIIRMVHTQNQHDQILSTLVFWFVRIFLAICWLWTISRINLLQTLGTCLQRERERERLGSNTLEDPRKPLVCWCLLYIYSCTLSKHRCGSHPINKKQTALVFWCLQGCCHRGVAKKRPSGFGMKKALFTSESSRCSDDPIYPMRVEGCSCQNKPQTPKKYQTIRLAGGFKVSNHSPTQ